MSSHATSVAATTSGHSHRSHRHRSKSSQRTQELEKPKKKLLNKGSTSLVSIPNTIKLSMLNSGLISIGEYRVRTSLQLYTAPRALAN